MAQRKNFRVIKRKTNQYPLQRNGMAAIPKIIIALRERFYGTRLDCKRHTSWILVSYTFLFVNLVCLGFNLDSKFNIISAFLIGNKNLGKWSVA